MTTGPEAPFHDGYLSNRKPGLNRTQTYNGKARCNTRSLGVVEAGWEEGRRHPGTGAFNFVLLRHLRAVRLGGSPVERSPGHQASGSTGMATEGRAGARVDGGGN